MNWDVVENAIAMITIAAIAIFASKLNVDSALSGAAIAAIAGLAGHGVSSTFQKMSAGKDKDKGID